jgi:hypothetical protein
MKTVYCTQEWFEKQESFDLNAVYYDSWSTSSYIKYQILYKPDNITVSQILRCLVHFPFTQYRVSKNILEVYV